MFTSTMPAFAVANCTTTHSALFSDQIPTRSPRPIPNASSPAANASARATSSRYVHRTPWLRTISASPSGTRAAVRSRFCPSVSPSSGVDVAPCT